VHARAHNEKKIIKYKLTINTACTGEYRLKGVPRPRYQTSDKPGVSADSWDSWLLKKIAELPPAK
jgi:hypothetical protein